VQVEDDSHTVGGGEVRTRPSHIAIDSDIVSELLMNHCRHRVPWLPVITRKGVAMPISAGPSRGNRLAICVDWNGSKRKQKRICQAKWGTVNVGRR
jgi:hypothetical protein